MLLAIDVGNTNIVIGCMDGERILFTERLSTDQGKTSLEYAILFKTALDIHKTETSQIDGAIISSVVPPVTPVIVSDLGTATTLMAIDKDRSNHLLCRPSGHAGDPHRSSQDHRDSGAGAGAGDENWAEYPS